MKRTQLNFLIDAAAFAGFVLLTTTGVLMRYVLPPGSGHNTTIWGFDRHEWGGIHFWVSVVFFAILALHLVLHRRWIINVVSGHPRGDAGIRFGLGLVGLVAVVALAVSPLLAPVEQAAGGVDRSSLSAHRYEGASIRGSMTLREIEAATGVPSAYILQKLGLPETVSAEEQLGPLRRTYSFEIDDVREIVRDYREHGGGERQRLLIPGR